MTSLATASTVEWSPVMSSIQNQESRCGLSSFKLKGLGAPGESSQKSSKRRMEGEWSGRGGLLLYLTASLLLQGKMGKNRERWDYFLGEIQKLSHSPELVECI